MSNYRPLGQHIQIRPDQEETTTQGGLIRATRKIPNTGTIIALSPDYDFSVAVGDKVQYLNNQKEELEDGTILVREEAILFVYN